MPDEEGDLTGASGEVPPSYDGPCRLLFWRHDPKDGMTVDFTLHVPGALGGHPFRAMLTGKEAGQRMRISCRRHDEVGEITSVYEGEAVLLRWSENDRTGMMARLEIDDGPDGEVGRHPFFPFNVGRSHGEPFYLRVVAVGEDERGVAPSKMKRRTPFHDMEAVKQAHIMCRDARFRAFLRANLQKFVRDDRKCGELAMMDDKPDAFPVAAIRATLEVPSLAVMNHMTDMGFMARRRWARMLDLYRDEVHHYGYAPPGELPAVVAK
jgi:hypothetical protein